MEQVRCRFVGSERERFWLIDGMLASVPLGKVRGLARHPDVQYVEYDQTDALPPVNNVILDARNLRVELGDAARLRHG